jgi:uncharacterized protein YcfL
MKHPRRTISGLFLLTAAIALPGCGANTYSTGEPGSNVDLQRRVIRDAALASDVQITAARLRSSAGNAIGQITVQNTSSFERRIAVKWSWLDGDGASLTLSDKAWENYLLAGGEVRDISSAGGPDGKDFRVSIRNRQ